MVLICVNVIQQWSWNVPMRIYHRSSNVFIFTALSMAQILEARELKLPPMSVFDFSDALQVCFSVLVSVHHCDILGSLRHVLCDCKLDTWNSAIEMSSFSSAHLDRTVFPNSRSFVVSVRECSSHLFQRSPSIHHTVAHQRLMIFGSDFGECLL